MNPQKTYTLNNLGNSQPHKQIKEEKIEQPGHQPKEVQIKIEDHGQCDNFFQVDYSRLQVKLEEHQNENDPISIKREKRKNYCELEEFDFSDSDQNSGDENWQDEHQKKKKQDNGRRKLIRMTRYIYDYLLKHSIGNYTQIFEQCAETIPQCKDPKKKRNFQRRFYEAINGMDSVGIIVKDKSQKTIELQNYSFVEETRKGKSQYQNLQLKLEDYQKVIEQKKYIRNKFRAAYAIYAEFHQRSKKRHEKNVSEAKQTINFPLSFVKTGFQGPQNIQAEEQGKVKIVANSESLCVDSEVFALSFLFPSSEFSKEIRDLRKTKNKK